MSALFVRDVIAALDRIAPPHLALDNDPRGLLVGDPSTAVAGIVVALDVTAATMDAATSLGAQMIVAHHPLIYHPLRTIRTDEAHPGSVVHACIRHGISVACAHTNWDIAPGGVNDVLAGLIGIRETRPVRITHREPLVSIAVFVPAENRDAVMDAMFAAGAGAIGAYDRCAFTASGEGTFRPLPGANPTVGGVGTPETVNEVRVEMILPAEKQDAVLAAMRAAHPYEEAAHYVYPLRNTAADYGLGRVGTLPEPTTARALRERLQRVLGIAEIRVAGPLDRRITTVAVGGGACAELVPDAVALGADALITSDVRHHEFVDADARGFALIDAGHAATETPGARELAGRLRAALGDRSVTVTFVDGPSSREA